MLNINGYYINDELRRDRCDTNQGRGGGLLVYIKDGLKVTPIECDIVYNSYVVFNVKPIEQDGESTQNLNVVLFYRSPNSTENNTQGLINLLNKFKVNTVFIGDLNLPKIDWVSGTSDRKGRNVLECINSNCMSQLIDFPTHESRNILDVVITDRTELVFDVNNVGNIGNSDHAAINIELLIKCDRPENVIKCRDWCNGDSEGFKTRLADIQWRHHLSNLTGTEVWNKFDSLVQSSLDEFIPVTTLKHKSKRPLWMNKHCKHACNRKSRLFRVYLKHKSKENFDRYKEAERICAKTVRNAKKRFEKKLANNNDKKKFSSYVKSRTKLKEPIGPLKVNGTFIHDEKQICDILNTFFGSVFTRESVDTIPHFEDLHGPHTIESLEITPQMIKDEINKLKPSTSAGPGGYSNRFLKDYKEELAEPLSIVFKELLTSNAVPDKWKLAHVVPIFKKGSKGDPGNYRPVSLTCVVGKLFERLIKTAICQHLEDNDLLTSAQHGFRAGRSCTTNLLEFLEKVTSSIDEGIPYDIIYYDFSKAFDKVPTE